MDASNHNLPLWLAFLAINEQASRDWLTGLHNRRYFEESLADHIAVANRYDRELSLVLFDIDHFKQINDTRGHEAGDTVLKAFAEHLNTSARSADIICRHGGDEFAVILPETGRASAEHFVKRVTGGIGDPILRQPGTPTPATIFSVTAGIASLPCNTLFADADSDLLTRKRAR